MQASIHTFDEATGAGSVLLDDGREHPFSAEVFAASGLRHVRVGQRLTIELGDAPATGSTEPEAAQRAPVRELWIVGVGEGRPIR